MGAMPTHVLMMAVSCLRSGSVRREGRHRGVTDRHRAFNGHPVAVLLDDVENPLAECLCYRSPGEHGEEVATAEGEDAGAPLSPVVGLCGNFNYLRHIWREFIGVVSVKTRNLIFASIPESSGEFCSANPRLIAASDGGESEIVEAKRN